MFCKHDWKILSEIKTQSIIEHADELGLTLDGVCRASDLRRKYIQTFVCNKCGKLKRFVEDI